MAEGMPDEARKKVMSREIFFRYVLRLLGQRKLSALSKSFEVKEHMARYQVDLDHSPVGLVTDFHVER